MGACTSSRDGICEREAPTQDASVCAGNNVERLRSAGSPAGRTMSTATSSLTSEHTLKLKTRLFSKCQAHSSPSGMMTATRSLASEMLYSTPPPLQGSSSPLLQHREGEKEQGWQVWAREPGWGDQQCMRRCSVA